MKRFSINDVSIRNTKMIMTRSMAFASIFITIIFTIINTIEKNYELAIVTGSTTIVVFIIFFSYYFEKNNLGAIITALLMLFLGAFFNIKGLANGFAALWILATPFTMFFLKIRRGALLSFLSFLLLVFFYWTPYGRSLLEYNYSSDFILRFPLLYSFFAVSLGSFSFILDKTTFELKKSEEKYHKLMTTDYLTKLPNRLSFDKDFKKILEVKTGYVGVIIIDLDDFKVLNDTYGHLFGDKALVYVSNVLKKIFGDTGFLSRWGGEEFTVIYHSMDKKVFSLLAEKIRKEISSKIWLKNSKEITITVSVGVSVFPCGYLSQDDAFEAADVALYSAKQKGKNRVCIKDIEQQNKEKETCNV